MTYRSPPIERPVYIGLAGAEDFADSVSDGVSDGVQHVVEKAAPIRDMVLGGAIGATMIYVIPKLFDFVLSKIGDHNDGYSGNFNGISDTDFEPVELDVEE